MEGRVLEGMMEGMEGLHGGMEMVDGRMLGGMEGRMVGGAREEWEGEDRHIFGHSRETGGATTPGT